MVPGMMVLGEDGAKPVRSADMAEEEPERRVEADRGGATGACSSHRSARPGRSR
jgi:hypothetical protein